MASDGTASAADCCSVGCWIVAAAGTGIDDDQNHQPAAEGTWFAGAAPAASCCDTAAEASMSAEPAPSTSAADRPSDVEGVLFCSDMDVTVSCESIGLGLRRRFEYDLRLAGTSADGFVPHAGDDWASEFSSTLNDAEGEGALKTSSRCGGIASAARGVDASVGGCTLEGRRLRVEPK